MYGSWITDKGEVIDVPGQCEHKRYKDYCEAYDEGWIAQINGKYFFCARWTPHTVTKKALRALRKMVKETEWGGEFMFDTLLDGQENLYGMEDEDGSRAGALKFLNQLIREM